MPEIVSQILLLVCLLQIKHMLADFFLQTPRMLSGRGNYLHLGRAQHAGVHCAFTALIFVLFGTNPAFVVAVVIAEWIVHFNIDWCKARYSEVRKLSPTQAVYWYAMGVDQALHQLTYVAMVWAWAKYAAA